jgi:hypothetical protein
MARMIPSVFDESTPSPGERRLFERLQRDPGTEEWTVLHSLDLAVHPSQVCGEVDFVVVAPGLGVLCLEVKASKRVARDADGNWLLGSKPPTTRSPFNQADGQMRSIMNFLRKGDPDLGRVPVLCAVWFTNCRAELPPSVEWHDWQLLDQNNFTRSVAITLTEVFSKGRRHLTEKAGKKSFVSPDAKTCDRVVRILRPEFELAVSLETVRSSRAQHIQHFTEEQYDALDTMDRSPRVLFTGPAGTGKTFLALEAARRAARRGQSVLLVCYNRLLAKWLRNVAPEGVQVTTLHKLMCQVADVSPPPDAPSTWWSSEMPDLAVEALLDSPDSPADVLIVDEAQDLTSPTYLDVLDLSVAGGLSAGTWRMFGDFERQAIFDRKAGAAALTGRVADTVQAVLGRNCRNTPRVGAMAVTLAGIDPEYLGYRRPDDGVNVVFRPYASHADQERLLLNQLRVLEEEGFAPDDVVILSASATGAAASTRDPVLLGKLCPLGESGSGRVRFGTVHAFKGLDAPAVVVTDVAQLTGRTTQDLLYVAMTRSTGPLCLLVSRDLGPEIAELVTRGASGA